MSESTPSAEPVQRARAAYQRHATDWDFLGYEEAVAVAILTEYFAERRRGGGAKPLPILKTVGRRRIQAIVEATRAASDGGEPPS